MENFFKLVKVGKREDDRIIWKRGDFVLIVAITQKKEAVLIQEYKQAVKRTLLCIPAGSMKKGESPRKAAYRELKEETGYVGTKSQVFGPFFNSPDKSTERHFVVVVTDVVRQGEATPEENETILGVELCPIRKAKHKLIVGMHRMAMDVALESLEKR